MKLAMESDGVLECYLSSVIERQLRILTYIGNRDTKSFQYVIDANHCPGFVIKNAECVGHVQKRVGTRLRKFKKEKELMPASYYDDKKDKTVKIITFYLTHKSINRLQNDYGIAVRDTCQASVPALRKAVGSLLFHCSEAVDTSAIKHQFCPRSFTS